MNEWNKILTVYQNFISVDESEVLWLKEKFKEDNFDNNVSWIELSDKEKQIKRIVRLKVISRSIDYTLGFSNYEDGIIDLYEAIEKSLANIDSMAHSDLRVCRLKLYLLLTKKKINAYRNPKDIKELFLLELKNVIYDCLNSNLEDYFSQQVNILYLERKVYIMQRIMNEER
ncbi:uncharacterized protein CHSO_2008 [Chryseobacterium sp. StRB126]|uniref:hypothetical protein n=1 Tax=Chryseobacterium sp. StRB126 TaxID=878220 RepID=UPI0004E988DD|nr:hypothetical protein [Chryseobacterium sp. StRB126]BAP31045.1 uncharacterized protein CHSO_2008 [Chryseobacterium sp. StRB126]